MTRLQACFDRGALVAIPPEHRGEYVQVTDGLMERGARILLVTVEHDGYSNGKVTRGRRREEGVE